METSVIYIPAESTKPFKHLFLIDFFEQRLLNAFVDVASSIFISLLRGR